MKKIFKFITIVSLLFFVSCEEGDLSPQPADEFTPDTFYQTPNDFLSAARGMYSGMIAGAYYGGSMISRPDILADNAILAQRGRLTNRLFFEWRYVPNSAWEMMTNVYLVTNRANRIITSIDNLPAGTERNNFLGEAKAVRAFVLLDAARVYSKIPTQSGDALESLGMNIVESIDPTFQELRPTVQETYDFIVSELEEAKTLIGNDNGNTRFTKDGVNALLSRVYLYTGQYDLAVARANDVTTPTATRTEFSDIWTDSNAAGVILKIDQDRNLDGITVGVEWSQSGDGGLIPEYSAPNSFFSLYDNTDIRQTAYFDLLPDSNNDLYNAITKYFGEAGQVNGIVDPKLIRKAEVLLNKAEAQFRSPNFSDAEALATLDELRSNRYAGFVSPGESGQDLLDAILLERRLELAYESHRFFDLKRLGLPVERLPNEGEFFDGTGTPAERTTLPAGDDRFQLPISQNEINIFPEYQQNPGY
jgi:hypothetical protein